MRSELAVPLIGASGRLEGVLNLESPAVGAFSEEDSHLLQALATQAVIAIQEVRLLDALQEMAELLLTQPCQQVLGSPGRAGLRAAERRRQRHLDACRANELALLRPPAPATDRGDRLPLRRQPDRPGHPRPRRRSPPATCVPIRALHRPDLARAQAGARALIVPLLAGDDGEPVGAFSVYSARRRARPLWPNRSGTRRCLTFLAHYAALARQNAARQEALRAAQEQRAVAETFAAVGDIAANLLHHLNNKVGTIPVRVEGIQDKCPAVLAGRPLSGSQPGRDRAQRRRGDGRRARQPVACCIRSTSRRSPWRLRGQRA